jgi:hypothetical protein
MAPRFFFANYTSGLLAVNTTLLIIAVAVLLAVSGEEGRQAVEEGEQGRVRMVHDTPPPALLYLLYTMLQVRPVP